MIFIEGEENIASYKEKNQQREKTLLKTTLSMVEYFMGLGNSKEQAESKVKEISNEVAPYVYVYVLGNNTPITEAINISSLEFMTPEVKSYLLNILNPE